MTEPNHEREARIWVNGKERSWSSGTLPEVIRQEGADPARSGIAVAVNGEVVPRGEWAGTAVRPGDRIEIVGAVQGG